ncbi:transglutaminase-like putative cysteine protease [Mycolicibacterium mucogenicum 261Sha1.1M5]|nr:transglutaminase-like putative cysteine protease [Mycolicibacterium mucogenicum 261Sha1.1M5]
MSGAPRGGGAERPAGSRHPDSPTRVVALGIAVSALWLLSLWGLTGLLLPQGWWGAAAAITSVVTLLTSVGISATRLSYWTVVAIAGLTGGAIWVGRLLAGGRLHRWISAPDTQLAALEGEVLRGVAPLDASAHLHDLVLVLVWVWSLVAVVVLTDGGRSGRAGRARARENTAPSAKRPRDGVPGAVIAALLIATPPMLVPLITDEPTDPAWLFALVALLAAIVWIAATRMTLRGGVAAAGAAALAAGVFAVIPEIPSATWNQDVQYAPVGGYVDDVTIELARDLRAGSTTPVLTYTSDSEQSIYLRLATLSTFEGGTWRPDDTLNPAGVTVADKRVLTGPNGQTGSGGLAALEELAAGKRDDQGRILIETDASELRFSATTGRFLGVRANDPQWAGFEFEFAEDAHQYVDVTIAALRSSWLPLPSGATQVREGDEGAFDATNWVWTRAAETAVADSGMTKRGDTYRAEIVPWHGAESRMLLGFLPPELLQVYPDARQAPRALRPYLDLPGTMPASMQRLREELGAKNLDRIGTGVVLEQYFRQSGQFTYDEAAPYLPGADADSPFAVMDAFLTTKSGYCVHFATTFATLARSLGVPTRVAVGYASRARGETPVAVRSKELHAWPEIYIDHVGWIPFEPTPGGAGLRAQGGGVDTAPTITSEAPDSDSARPDAPEAGAEELAGENRPLTDAELNEAGDPAAPGATTGSAATVWLVTGALAAALLVLTMAPALVRIARRAVRVRAIRAGRQPAGAAWAEFTSLLRDYGRVPGGAAAVRPAGTGAAPPRSTGAVMPAPSAQTPDALIAAVLAGGGISSTDGRAAADVLVQAVNAERYGPASEQSVSAPLGPLRGATREPQREDTERLLGALNTIRAELRERASRRERARARWLPPSLHG